MVRLQSSLEVKGGERIVSTLGRTRTEYHVLVFLCELVQSPKPDPAGRGTPPAAASRSVTSRRKACNPAPGSAYYYAQNPR